MDSEEIYPDFEVGISDKVKSDGEKPDGSQHSESDERDGRSAAASVAAEETASESQPEGLKTTTERQLEKLLSRAEPKQGDSKAIKRRGTKRQRLSRSTSITTGQASQRVGSPEKTPYLSPSKIANIFDRDISSKSLCKLSALKRVSPEAITKIMPGASVDQICQMCDLQEEQTSPGRQPKAKPGKASSSRRPRAKKKKSRRRARSTSSVPVLDRMKEHKVKTEPKELNLFNDGFPVPSPVEGK